ncbi:MAG: CvpA family protein [Bacillota bacterium]
MNWQGGWTWLDAVWVVIIGALLLRGFLRGFFQELLEVLVLALAFYAGARLYTPLANWLVDRFGPLPEQAARAAAFGVVAAAILGAGLVLTGMVVHLVRLSPLSWVDSLGGALAGGAKGLAVVAALVVVLAGLPPGDLRDELSDSVISRELRALLPVVWGEIRQAFPDFVPPLPTLSEPGDAELPGGAPRRSSGSGAVI